MNSIKKSIEIKWKTVINYLVALLMLSGIATIARELQTINKTIEQYHPIEIYISRNGGAVNE